MKYLIQIDQSVNEAFSCCTWSKVLWNNYRSPGLVASVVHLPWRWQTGLSADQAGVRDQTKYTSLIFLVH